MFHDESALSANPGLWSSITDALDESEWFVLLASPDAAQSEWVNREVEYWCTHKDPARVLPVVTEGEWAWDGAAGGFDMALCTAVPLALVGVFREEPRHIDMRWARSDAQLDLQNGRFRDQVAELAAPMHGVAKDDLAGDDVRQHRRTLRTAWGAVALLLLLLAASVTSALVAVRSADEARASEQEAVDARVEADRQAALAVSSEQEAQQRKDEADVSAAEASRQRNQADRNALEAERQRVAADQNAANAEAARRAADSANEQLASTVDELSETNAELDQSNDDLATANDDLATANDDLDQSNRQLDDTNQALASSNQQLESTNEQLSAANNTLTAQAANLDVGRLAGLADDESERRLDVALLLAAAAERRAATDDRIPNTTLFDLVETRGQGLDRVLHFNPGTALSVAVSPDDETIATVTLDDAFTTAEVSVWSADAPAGTRARTIRFPMSDAPARRRDVRGRGPLPLRAHGRADRDRRPRSTAATGGSRSRCHRHRDGHAGAVVRTDRRSGRRTCTRPGVSSPADLPSGRRDGLRTDGRADRRPHRLDREPAPRSSPVAARRRRRGIARRRDGTPTSPRTAIACWCSRRRASSRCGPCRVRT